MPWKNIKEQMLPQSTQRVPKVQGEEELADPVNRGICMLRAVPEKLGLPRG